MIKRRPIVCVNTGKIYTSLYDACMEVNGGRYASTHLSRCLTTAKTFNKCYWMDYKEYKKFNNIEDALFFKEAQKKKRNLTTNMYIVTRTHYPKLKAILESKQIDKAVIDEILLAFFDKKRPPIKVT